MTPFFLPLIAQRIFQSWWMLFAPQEARVEDDGPLATENLYYAIALDEEAGTYRVLEIVSRELEVFNSFREAEKYAAALEEKHHGSIH